VGAGAGRSSEMVFKILKIVPSKDLGERRKINPSYFVILRAHRLSAI
jgi:hypothetical protein